ncbi:MAG TPA: hypothetical protein VFA00_11215 [Actinomycetota bacterium]|nr:hypothetical protein [Actinomycetota bacterium]
MVLALRRPARRLVLAIVVGMFLAACGGSPTPGSEDDFKNKLDALPVPSSMSGLEDRYSTDCEVTCPMLVRWYDIAGPVETARSTMLAELEAAGMSPQPNGLEPDVITMKSDEYFYFIAFGKKLRGSDSVIPDHVDADIAVTLLPQT